MKGRKEPRITAGGGVRRAGPRGGSLGKYGTIEKIVAFDVPQWALFFSRQFEHRTVAEVLAHDFENPTQPCVPPIALTPEEVSAGLQCVYITSRRDDERVYHNMVTRTITYAVEN